MPSNKDKNMDKTKMYKINENKKRKPKKPENTNKVKKPKMKEEKGKKKKKGKFASKHPKIASIIKMILFLFLLLCVIGAGIIAGIFFGLFGNDFEITKDELKVGASNSIVVDQSGNVIANLSGDEKRKIITLEEMAEYLPKAYVAIEDERFYSHNGVDLKRTAGAIFKTIIGKGSFGGSTITQQLVKNITKDDQASGFEGIKRKVKEWAKAYQVERMISKDQILELYLNILYIGQEGNLHGVELGAEYYFNKSAKDLDLAECAYLAGINSSPNYYNPYVLNSESDTEEKRDERIKNKTITVLNKMKELGFIEKQEDYDAATQKVRDGLPFSKGATSTGNNHSYHTDAAIEQVINQVMDEKGISRELARNYVYSSGLTIYTTVDPAIQSRVEEETKKDKYIINGYDKDKNGEKVNDHTQAAIVVIDYKTGYVVGVSGGLGEKTGANLNRATQTRRQPGSCIKPIADISPAIEEKIITAATVYDDVLTDFNGYQPKDDGRIYRGLINIRDIIAYSQNVPEVKIMKELTPAKSIDYLRNFGITSLYKASENKDHNDEGLPLAIGGVTQGISPLEMAAAYGTIANDGEYITPTFYIKVEDSSKNVVLTPNQERRRVISEQNAYIVKSILKEPVKKGTASYCAIRGIDVAAKTGTTDKSYDRWLCGFTPYYAAACWFGYDRNEEVRYNGANPAGQIWDAVMTDIHKNLENASFTRPSGIVEQTICKTTGCLATAECTNTYREIFTSDNLPTKCEGHGSQEICSESGKIATEYCSQFCDVETRQYGGTVPKEQLKLWKNIGSANRGESNEKVEEVCDIHTEPKEEPKPIVVEIPAPEPVKKEETVETKPQETEKTPETNNTTETNTTTNTTANTTPTNTTDTEQKNETSTDKKDEQQPKEKQNNTNKEKKNN